MENQYIQFKKQREIGEIISDTFKFLRENYKLLFSLIFKIAGPAFLILLLCVGYYLFLTFGFFEKIEKSPNFLFSNNFFTPQIFLAAIVMLVSLLIYSSLLYGTVLYFIKSYIENNGVVDETEVKYGVRNLVWELIGTSVIISIMVFFGLLLCFFPGIYLMVPLSLAFSIIVFDKLSIIDAISHCFKLIQGNWWVTFAALLVMWLLIYIIGIIFSLPALFYSLIKGFTMAQEISAAKPSEIFDWIYLALNLLSTLAQYLLYTIMVIATAFIYFNLNEKKNFTGTYENIENLGKGNDF
ncbi:MAG TPA: hypothetical protein VFM82_09220 [Flavobacteriaceae bacterium]|nr:hypothetical protein [Flavobacteriaceae bacterium]